MGGFARALCVGCAAALTLATAFGGEGDDVRQRLKALEDENKELRKQVLESAELRKEVEKLGTELRQLLARVDKFDVAVQNLERVLGNARKDLEARLAELVQQELQAGRRPRFAPGVPARFVERPYLGFDGQDIEPDVAAALNLKTRSGVLVTEVREGGPAAVGGLRKNDVIVGLDGVEIKRFQGFRDALGARKGGEAITLTVLRGEEKLEVKLTLGVRRVPQEN